jgi:hypothetical protein
MNFSIAFKDAFSVIALFIILSRVRGSVTNNNGFWIGWSALLPPSLQLQPITTAQNQWLSKTRSIPDWPTSVFSSTVTWLGSDLWIRHFFSFRGPLVTTPQLKTELSYECQMTELSFRNFESSRIETTISNSSSVTVSIHCRGNVLTEPLSSNGLFRFSSLR